MSNLALVTDNMLPVANETFIDNLSAGISAGAAIIPMNSLSEYSDGDSVVLTVDPGTASQATFIGEKQGNTVINCKWTEGNIGASHDAGATVIDYDSATHYNVITKLLRNTHNQDSTLKTTAVQQALNITSAVPADYILLANAPSSAEYFGDNLYNITYDGLNYTDRLTPGAKLRIERATLSPVQSANLNGTNQNFSKSAPAGMTGVTDDFTISVWVKLDRYPTTRGAIVSRYNGASGWSLQIGSDGVVAFVGFNGANTNYSQVASVQSVPLNTWVHISAQLDMSAYTATPTTSYIMLNGVDVPAVVSRAGTNPTALVQAGNLEIGSRNGGDSSYFPGKIAQVAIYNTKIPQATIRNTISQGISGTETNLISAYTLSNSTNDLNTTNANNLVANNGASTTNDDSPFGGQASGAISAKIDYATVVSVVFTGGNTVVSVNTLPVNKIPTIDSIIAIAYSNMETPYGMPLDTFADNAKFSAYMVGAQNTIAGNQQIINLNTTSFNPGSGFSLTNNGYTVQVPGYYRIDFSAGIGASTSRMFAVLKVGGNDIARGTDGSVTGADKVSNGSKLVKLAMGDVIKLAVWANAATAISSDPTQTYLTASLVK